MKWEVLIELPAYINDRWHLIFQYLGQHANLILLAIILAVILGVAGGILLSYNDRAARMILAVTGTIMTIPSIAMFAFLIPLFGIGIAPALVGLTLYCLLPILRNTYTGLKNIDPAVLLAAQGMGMGEAKILWRIKLPLAFMVIMAGIRTAVVMGVGITAVAAYIGAGGLGQFIFRGISRANDKMVLTGAIFVAILAILLDYGLGWVERKLGT